MRSNAGYLLKPFLLYKEDFEKSQLLTDFRKKILEPSFPAPGPYRFPWFSVNFIQKIRPVTAGKSKLRTGNPVSAKLITIGSACHAKIESEKSTPKIKYIMIFFGGNFVFKEKAKRSITCS